MGTVVAAPASLAERKGLFEFAKNGTTFWRDTRAGTTTFVVMSYIIFVNAAILSFAGVKGLEGKGLPFAAVATSTCLVACVMSVLMGLVTNYAYAIAPGMGLNAVVAFGLVASGKATFPEAMGLVVLEGAAMVALAITGLREMIFRAIPLELKKAIAIGIGLFIAFIGLYNSGIVKPGAGTPVALADFTTWPLFVTVVGIVLTLSLRALDFKGDLLVGIIGTTVVATIVNHATGHAAFGTQTATWPGWGNMFHHPDFSLLGNVSFSSFSGTQLGVVASLVWVFALFLSDFFDFSGTSIGVGQQAGYVDKNGDIPRFKSALVVDGLAAMAGGGASASSATTYIESGAGVGDGGRTGWVACVAGLWFLPFMFITPLIGMVPAQATAAALIVVGYLMIRTLTEKEGEAEKSMTGAGNTRAGIDFHDLAIGVGAVLIIMIMPFTYSITNGIGWGFIAYTLIRSLQNLKLAMSPDVTDYEWSNRDRVHPFMWLVTAAFIFYFLVPLLQTHGVL